jgi:hypothetical protein
MSIVNVEHLSASIFQLAFFEFVLGKFKSCLPVSAGCVLRDPKDTDDSVAHFPTSPFVSFFCSSCGSEHIGMTPYIFTLCPVPWKS